MQNQDSNMTRPIDLPLVDISNPDCKAAGKAMLNAAVEYGFLYIDSRTTAFTKADVESAFDLVCQFCINSMNDEFSEYFLTIYSRKSSSIYQSQKRPLINEDQMWVI